MKPRIFKRGADWFLVYAYHPRQFWLFGMNAEQRKHITDLCVCEVKLSSLEDAFEQLRSLYKYREVRLPYAV